ncbi:hypothetical protein Tco_0611732, partial [Tanacetum coccineum]
GDSVERVITTAASLDAAWQSQAPRHHGGAPAQTRSERVLEKSNEPPLSKGDRLGEIEGCSSCGDPQTNEMSQAIRKTKEVKQLTTKNEEIQTLDAKEASTMAFELIKFIKSMIEE